MSNIKFLQISDMSKYLISDSEINYTDIARNKLQYELYDY